jgi:hypothetical protein
MHAIAARGLIKTYPKNVRALDGLSFEAARVVAPTLTDRS